jgi:uroporphyrinogen-III synthase
MAARGVLITRPAEDAGRLAQAIRERGRAPVLAPLFAVRTRPIAPVPGVQAVLVTSGNALPALPAAWHGTALLAVGDATAARARAAGFSRVRSAAGDARALAALAREALLPEDGAVLLASGEGQGEALAAMLRAAGFAVERRTAYAVQPVAALPRAAAAAIEGGTLAAATFLSAATARLFLDLLPGRLRGALAQIDALAIGGPAAAALEAARWRSVRCAAAPNLDALLDLL